MIGRYHVLDPLGQGAMGVVVRAFDPELGRVVAIKSLRPSGESADVEQARERRFVVEARSVARLRHPGIVTVYDVGRSQGGAYMVMECVQGLNVRQCLNGGVRFSVPGALHLMDAVLAALEHAHAHQIVHRDVKPENILVDSWGHVKLTDFGIAKMLDLEGSHATLMDGQLIGTPRYMSPEQLRGETPDARCDVFACGVLLFELLAGQPPFGGTQVVEIVQSVLNQDVPDLADFTPEAPPGLNGVLRQALQKDAAQRLPSITHLRQALAEVVVQATDHSEVLAPVDPAQLTDWVVPQSRPILEALLAAVKSVNPADCVLAEVIESSQSALQGQVDPDADTLPLGGSTTASGEVRARAMGDRLRVLWVDLMGGWRSTTLLGALVLLVAVVWLLGRPVSLPAERNPAAAASRTPTPVQIATDQSLVAGEQWVAPAPEVVALTMEREMKAPVANAAAPLPAPPPTSAKPAVRPALPSSTQAAAPPPAPSNGPNVSSDQGSAGELSRQQVGTDAERESVQPSPRGPSEPCTGLGFFQREMCLWEQCETQRYRRHPVCARFR